MNRRATHRPLCPGLARQPQDGSARDRLVRLAAQNGAEEQVRTSVDLVYRPATGVIANGNAGGVRWVSSPIRKGMPGETWFRTDQITETHLGFRVRCGRSGPRGKHRIRPDDTEGQKPGRSQHLSGLFSFIT